MAKISNDFAKRAVIAGAAAALKFKRKNPRDTETEILRKVIDQTRDIIRQIDRD